MSTWRTVALGATFASAKSMIDVFQATAGTRVLRVRRMYQFNNGLGSVFGVLTTMRVTRITASSAGTPITAVPHDTANTALQAAVTSGTGRTVTASDVFRQYIWSNDEPAVSGASQDEWELLVPFCEIWNAGYGEVDVQPLVCRPTQGVQILHSGASAVGANDFEIEFTDSAS